MSNRQIAKRICLEAPVRSFAPHVLSTCPHIAPANRLKYQPVWRFYEQDQTKSFYELNKIIVICLRQQVFENEMQQAKHRLRLSFSMHSYRKKNKSGMTQDDARLRLNKSFYTCSVTIIAIIPKHLNAKKYPKGSSLGSKNAIYP